MSKYRFKNYKDLKILSYDSKNYIHNYNIRIMRINNINLIFMCNWKD